MGQQILPSSDARGKDKRRDVPLEIQTHWVPPGNLKCLIMRRLFIHGIRPVTFFVLSGLLQLLLA